MKTILLSLAFLCLMPLLAAAQKPYAVSKDDQTGATIFKGPITFTDLSDEATFGWMKRGETAYKPDSAVLRSLAKSLPGYSILTVMGTWCDDSQNLVPKLAKVLAATKYPMSQYAMFGVDRAKETGGIEKKLYGIEKVPTIIVFKGNTEIGRITENVQKSIEADLLAIVKGKE